MRAPTALEIARKKVVFFLQMCEYLVPQTIENKLAYRILGNGRGWAFSPRDFLDIGERATVDSALHRLMARGEVRRVIRGIYDYPRFSKLLEQQVSPDIDQVARTIGRKFRWRIQPSGATAMNLLGLSTQVPGRVVYLSDGPDRAGAQVAGRGACDTSRRVFRQKQRHGRRTGLVPA